MEQLETNSYENLEELRNKKISEIEPLEDHHYKIENREDLSKFVERPLLSACQDLYDKNIETYMSSANKNNVGHTAYLSIIYDTLSEQNKEIAKKLTEEKIVKFSDKNEARPSLINIEIPVTEETTWEDIEKSSKQITNHFMPQQHLYTPDDLMNKFFLEIQEDESVNEITPEYFEKYGYSYNPENGMFLKN